MEWEFFSNDKELKCKHCGQMHMHEPTMIQLVKFRRTLDFPFPVISGYRCPEYNYKISKTGLDGPHTQGRAFDIRAYGYRAWEIVSRAREFGVQGIGVFQLGDHTKRYIHIDWCEPSIKRPRPWIWSY